MTALVVAIATPLSGVAALCTGTGWLESRLPPAVLVRLGTLASVVCAVGMAATFAVLGFAVLARDAEVAELGRWSPVVVRAQVPVPVAVGVAAGLLAVVMIGSGLGSVVRLAAEVLRAERLCRRLPRAGGCPVLLDDDRPDAYTVAGIRARAVITTGMLGRLRATERRVVIAHELSHLRHRHDIYLRCVRLAAAVNPLLRPARTAVAFAVERWADEDAAAIVGGDRRTVARTIAQAGLARGPVEHGELGMAQPRAVDRVQALLEPLRPVRRHAVLALCALITAVSTVTVLVESQVEDGVELARLAAALPTHGQPHHDHYRAATRRTVD